jgi:hypothetical protein
MIRTAAKGAVAEVMTVGASTRSFTVPLASSGGLNAIATTGAINGTTKITKQGKHLISNNLHSLGKTMGPMGLTGQMGHMGLRTWQRSHVSSPFCFLLPCITVCHFPQSFRRFRCRMFGNLFLHSEIAVCSSVFQISNFRSQIPQFFLLTPVTLLVAALPLQVIPRFPWLEFFILSKSLSAISLPSCTQAPAPRAVRSDARAGPSASAPRRRTWKPRLWSRR